jgi:hypothetical protein
MTWSEKMLVQVGISLCHLTSAEFLFGPLSGVGSE